MAGLKELRTRLSAVKSTQKITTAMKLVASSRLRKATTALMKNKNYASLFENAIARILLEYKKEEEEKNVKHILPKIFISPVAPIKYLLIVFSAERGLCGSYNQNVAKATHQRIQDLQKQGKQVQIICYGKKAYEILKKNHASNIIHHEPSFAGGGIFYSEALQMLEMINHIKESTDFDICEIVSAHFKTAMQRDILPFQIYPIDVSSINQKPDLDHIGDAYFDYKPSREELLGKIGYTFLKNRIFTLMLSAEASEQGARMMAMDNATENAKNMIGSLTLKYNTLRQSAITTELNEIISGAEAL